MANYKRNIIARDLDAERGTWQLLLMGLKRQVVALQQGSVALSHCSPASTIPSPQIAHAALAAVSKVEADQEAMKYPSAQCARPETVVEPLAANDMVSATESLGWP